MSRPLAAVAVVMAGHLVVGIHRHEPPRRPEPVAHVLAAVVLGHLPPPRPDGPPTLARHVARPRRHFRPASRGERAILACLRWAESRDAFYRIGYYPHPGWGDGGGAWQLEPTTRRVAARLARLPLANVSAGAQFSEALALLRRYGTVPWAGDGC